jgi:hypothetical protein
MQHVPQDYQANSCATCLLLPIIGTSGNAVDGFSISTTYLARYTNLAFTGASISFTYIIYGPGSSIPIGGRRLFSAIDSTASDSHTFRPRITIAGRNYEANGILHQGVLPITFVTNSTDYLASLLSDTNTNNTFSLGGIQLYIAIGVAIAIVVALVFCFACCCCRQQLFGYSKQCFNWFATGCCFRSCIHRNRGFTPQ